jgi:hypothetical protein
MLFPKTTATVIIQYWKRPIFFAVVSLGKERGKESLAKGGGGQGAGSQINDFKESTGFFLGIPFWEPLFKTMNKYHGRHCVSSLYCARKGERKKVRGGKERMMIGE